jgi:hypothetical protein
LLRQFLVTKEAKIRRLGSLLSRSEEELSTRNLGEITTDKLLDLILKVANNLERSLETIGFKKTEAEQFRSIGHFSMDRLAKCRQPFDL